MKDRTARRIVKPKLAIALMLTSLTCWAADQTLLSTEPDTPSIDHQTNKVVAQQRIKVELKEALRRTNGDRARAMAYWNGGEAGLRSYDAKRAKQRINLNKKQ